MQGQTYQARPNLQRRTRKKKQNKKKKKKRKKKKKTSTEHEVYREEGRNIQAKEEEERYLHSLAQEARVSPQPCRKKSGQKRRAEIRHRQQ